MFIPIVRARLRIVEKRVLDGDEMNYHDYLLILDKINDFVYDHNGKLVIDSLTGRPLAKWNKTGKETSLDLNDPDAALKKLEELNKGVYTITCSKCHHCR